MKSLLTPKQVARAMQVSESSIKRWCDKGTIPTQYTPGGHRRIPLSGLLEFLRASKHTLVRPEILGLPAAAGPTQRVPERAALPLAEALIAGDEQQCRQIVLDLYLAEHRMSVICDQVLAPALDAIGHRWSAGKVEIYQERRGCGIALHVLREMRLFLPPSPPQAPLAIGGAVEGDPYGLATAMVELVLHDARWEAVSLGENLPFATLLAAIQQLRPRLFWLSVSHLADEAWFVREYGRLFEACRTQATFVVGGRALTDRVRQQMKYAAFCDNLQHLESFVQTLPRNGEGGLKEATD